MLDANINIFQTAIALISFLLILSYFLFSIYLRSIIKKLNDRLKNHSSYLRIAQNKITEYKSETEMFSGSDPEPYGSIAEKIFNDLSRSSLDLAELNRAYVENKMMISKLVPLKIKNIFQIHRFFNLVKRGVNRFEGLQGNLENLFTILNTNIKRLANVSIDVSDKCRKIVEIINTSRSKLLELEELNLKDEEFLDVSKSLGNWEQTIRQQIPISFLTVDPNFGDSFDQKVMVAKIFRLINNLEPEIKNLALLISTWKSNYEKIIFIQDAYIRTNDEIFEKMLSIKTDKNLHVSWETLESRVNELDKKLQAVSSHKLTVKNLANVLTDGTNLIEQQETLDKELTNIWIVYEDIAERFKRKDPHHKLEWLKNAQKSLIDAEEYNLDNFTDKNNVEVIRRQIDELITRQSNLIAQIEKGELTPSSLERYLKFLRLMDTEFLHLDKLYKEFFSNFQQIRKQEEQTKSQLTQFYPSLKQLDEISHSNPVLQKYIKNTVQNYLRDIEEMNQGLSKRDEGTVIKKKKRWDHLSSKILLFVEKIYKHLNAENLVIKDKLIKQVEILQEFLALNEPVFYDAINLLKDTNIREAQKNVSTGRSEILELVHNIKEKSIYWQRLTASINGINDISGPILDQIAKLSDIRTELLKVMADADEKIPEVLSWPPTTKRLSVEREKYSNLENKFKLLKQERKNAVHLIAILSELTTEYKDLAFTIRFKVGEANEEQKSIALLEKRLDKSIELWRKLRNTYQDNFVVNENIQVLIDRTEKDYIELKNRYQSGKLPFSQTHQMLRVICRKIDQESVEFDDRRLLDISGELQLKL